MRILGFKVFGPRDVVALQRKLIAESLRRSLGVARAFGIPVLGMPVIWSFLARLEPDASGAYAFLSPEWIQAARKIRQGFQGRNTRTPPPFKVNHVVVGVPFGDGTLHAHTDTTSGDLEMDLGRLDAVDATVTLPYEIAKAILVNGDAQAAMQAFMSGQIKVEGDMSRLMALQTAQVDPVALEAATRIRSITA